VIRRPVLSPALARLWRNDGSLQLGRTPETAVVVEGVDRHLPRSLDGATTWERLLERHPQWASTLAALHANGLLLDADALLLPGVAEAERARLAATLASLTLVHGPAAGEALQARRDATVWLLGSGPVLGGLAGLLRRAGVGTVLVAGRGPEDAPTHTDADLVVVGPTASEEVLTLLRAGIPHLTATVDEATGVVGPLVLPGSSACLRCVELTRLSLDPQWPARTAACDPALAGAVAATAALQVLSLLEGLTPASVGGTLELTLPGWAWRRRTWPQHPGCGCGHLSVPGRVA
jgi:hypothetical protein